MRKRASHSEGLSRQTPARGMRQQDGQAQRASRNLSRLRKPEDLSLEAWQVALRRQFALAQTFRVKSIGDGPPFSEFEVTNPESGRNYRVAIRGRGLGENFCACPDFAVNTLGTCKHVEFVLEKLQKNRAARAALTRGIHPGYSEIYLHYGPRRDVRFRQGGACPPSVAKLARRHFRADGTLRDGRDSGLQGLLREAARRGHELRCYDDALSFIAQARDREALAKRIDDMFQDGAGSAAFSDLLRAELYRYQRDAALFAARTGRCLIADEMGLGKTVQAIAAAEILARLGSVERVLVVCPTSLKHQWHREIERFTDRPSVIVEGLLGERARRYAADAFYKITNYDVIHRDLDVIQRWEPDLVILDEAQRIKNWKTRTAKSIKQLRSNHAFVLTGTPLENRLEELYSIVEFVDRHRLGPMFRFLAEHQHLDDHGRVIGYKNLSDVARTLEPILIRRKKDEVLKELPERLEKTFFVAMTDEQMLHHEENREIVARIVSRWRRHGFLSETDQRRLQIALQNMRMSCDSTYLLDQVTDHGVKADEVAVLLDEVLEERAAKVVIFSQWLRMHELLVRRMTRRKLEHVLFHGGVPGRSRKSLIERFREDPACRVFLSTDAGGVGLNLQNAAAVINVDQPWNPAVLEQRVGRVHRLGQRHPVRVMHFVAQGTIEEGMLGLLSFKRSMFAGVLDGGQDEVFLGGTRLTRFMEQVEKATGGIPEAMPLVEEARTAEAERVVAPDDRDTREPSAGAGDPWDEVVSIGVSLLEKLGRAVAAGQEGRGPEGQMRALASGFVARDEQTGQSYLKLPMPKPDTLRQIIGLLSNLAGSVERREK